MDQGNLNHNLVHHTLLATKISTIGELERYERNIINIFKEGQILTEIYRMLDDLGHYKKFNCSFYVLTTPTCRKEDEYKIGFTTVSQKDLRDQYQRFAPRAEVVIFCPGYIILEQLMLNHPDILKVRIENNNDNVSEVINLSYRKIYSILYQFISIDNNKLIESFPIYSRGSINAAVKTCKNNLSVNVNGSTSLTVPKLDNGTEININITTPCMLGTNVIMSNQQRYVNKFRSSKIKGESIPTHILEDITDNRYKYETMTYKDLRFFIRNTLKCQCHCDAAKSELLAKLDDFVRAYKDKTLYTDQFSWYCDHKT